MHYLLVRFSIDSGFYTEFRTYDIHNTSYVLTFNILALKFIKKTNLIFLTINQGRITRGKAKSEEEERIINVKPTTHYEYRYKKQNKYS
jgi:hypothetical protein